VNARPDEQGLVRCRAIAFDYGGYAVIITVMQLERRAFVPCWPVL
jgi:hypothetical protein